MDVGEVLRLVIDDTQIRSGNYSRLGDVTVKDPDVDFFVLLPIACCLPADIAVSVVLKREAANTGHRIPVIGSVVDSILVGRPIASRNRSIDPVVHIGVVVPSEGGQTTLTSRAQVPMSGQESRRRPLAPQGTHAEVLLPRRSSGALYYLSGQVPIVGQLTNMNRSPLQVHDVGVIAYRLVCSSTQLILREPGAVVG